MPTFNSYFYHRYHKCLFLDTLYLIQNEWKIRSTWRISQITLEYVLVLDPLIYYRSKSVCLFHFRPKSTSKVYLYWTLMSVRSWSFSLADTKLAWFYQKKWTGFKEIAVFWKLTWGLQKLGLILYLNLKLAKV